MLVAEKGAHRSHDSRIMTDRTQTLSVELQQDLKRVVTMKAAVASVELI